MNSSPKPVPKGRTQLDWALLKESFAPAYPYRELFELLQRSGYGRYTLAEVAASPEPQRYMQYYKALWSELKPTRA